MSDTSSDLTASQWQEGDFFQSPRGLGVLSYRFRTLWSATLLQPQPGQTLQQARRLNRITVSEKDLTPVSAGLIPVPDSQGAEVLDEPLASSPAAPPVTPPPQPPVSAPPVPTPASHRAAAVASLALVPPPAPPVPPTVGGTGRQPLPPILTGASRYRVVPDDVIELRGHNLVQAVRVTIGGIELHILRRGPRSLTVQLPPSPVNGTLEVVTPHGRATLARPFTAQVTSQTQPPDPTATVPPPNPHDPDFDQQWSMMVRQLGRILPRPMQPVAQAVGNVMNAVRTAQSTRPFAPGGDWFRYSIDTSAHNRWREAQERQERYTVRAAADPNNQHWQNRARQAADIANQRRQQMAGAAVAGGVAGVGAGQAMGTSGVVSGVAGAVGTALGGPVVGVIASVVGGLVEGLVVRIVRAVHNTVGRIRARVQLGGELGERAVGHLVDGVRSTFSTVYDVGAQLAETLLGAIGQHLGPGGASVMRFGGQTIRTVGRLLEMGGEGAGNLLRGAGRIVGMGVVGGGAALGGLGGGLLGGLALGPIGGIIGGLVGSAVGSAVGAVVMRVVHAVADMGGHLIATFGRVFGEIGGLAVGLVRTVIDVMDQGRQALLEYASAAMSISNLSGRSIGMSQNLLLTRSAFGMPFGQTQSAYSAFGNMPLFSGAIKSAWGIRGAEGSEEEVRSTINTARGLPLMLRRVMLQNMPEGEEFWARLVGMPDRKINEQLAFFRNFDMGNGALKDAAEDLSLLQSRWDGFTSWLSRVVGQAVLPLVTTGLTRVTNFLKEHQGEIQGWVMNAGRWLFVELPSMLGQGLVWIGGAVQTMIRLIVDGLGALRHMITPVAVMLDGILTGARQAVIQMMALAAAAAAGPLAGPVYRDTYNRLDRDIPEIDVMGAANAAVRGLGAAQRGARNVLGPLDGLASAMQQTGQQWQAAQAQRQADHDSFLREIARNTGYMVSSTAATADATLATANGLDAYEGRLTQRIINYQVREESRALADMGF